MDNDTIWRVAPEVLSLGNEDVHVWRIFVDQAADQVRYWDPFLSTDERNRANRFHFQKDHDLFIVAHGALRLLLGRYLGAPPGQLLFQLGQHGKPALAAPFSDEGIRFNITHSHNLVLCAFTRGRDVGVDIELLRDGLDEESIVNRFFSAHEITALRALPKWLKREAFFSCWTRKEAFIKARGEGLSLPLNEFEITVDPRQPARLLNFNNSPEEILRWSLVDLRPGPAYVAALAVEGSRWRYTYFDLQRGFGYSLADF